MEFRVLGPLEAEEAGILVPLGAQKQRALLAVLLLGANEAVSLGRLVEELWEGEPPERADKAIQTYVSRLRARSTARASIRGGPQVPMPPAAPGVFEVNARGSRTQTKVISALCFEL